LKEYSEFKNILLDLEKKVDELKDKYSQNVKTKLTGLQKDIFDKNNLTNEQLLIKANKGRKHAFKEIKYLVDELVKKGGLIWKIAKKANS